MPTRRVILTSVLLIAIPLCVLVAVLRGGSYLTAPRPSIASKSAPSERSGPLDLPRLVIQIGDSAGVAIGRSPFQENSSAEVIGEMVAGILLGPSLLGWAAPALSAAIFPAASLGYLNALSQIGLILFMFLVGVSLDPNELRGQSSTRGAGQSGEHRRALLPRQHAGAAALRQAFELGREFPQLRTFHGRGNEYHRVPGVG